MAREPSINAALRHGEAAFRPTLIPDVWLFGGIEDRIQVNSGVLVFDTQQAVRAGYSPSAIVPKSDWQVIDAQSTKQLAGTTAAPCPWSRGIGMGETTGEFGEAVKRVRGLRLSTQAEADGYMKSDDFKAFSKSFGHFLEERSLLLPSMPKVLNICVRPPGWLTTTIDPHRRRRIGLHLDTWDHNAHLSRDLSRNRISVNLGSEDRFFLFHNVTMRTFLTLSGAMNHSSDLRLADASTDHLIAHFFRVFADYPVVKLRLRPGEFYVAPTENLVHDATSLGKTHPDVTIAALGYFNPNHYGP